MFRRFAGVWGSFENLDEAASVIEALRKDGKEISVLSPCSRHELTHALGEPRSLIPFVTLFFGGVGVFFGYALPSWTALDWVLPVSSKPMVSIPPYTIFGFELMVLLGGIFTAIGMLVLGYFDLMRKRLPGSQKFKTYGRFSDDRFGVVVRCAEGEAAAVEKVMKAYNVEECVSEF